ncbi:MAG: hypothetical protein FJ128_01355 [Deltaproteobacteria bacterium]|nr:hypothetical protein [Deltaproteobacteria bacterium]
MNVRQARTWGRLVGRIGMVFFLIAALAVLDVLSRRFREPLNRAHGLPGQTIAVDGPLEDDVKSVADLGVAVGSPRITVTLTEVHRGYFLGVPRWRGAVAVSGDAPPGTYDFAVHLKGRPANPESAFQVVVHADAAGLRANSPSVLERHLGVSPWLVVLTALPLILLTCGAMFLLSRRYEKLLQRQGQAEIYRINRAEGGFVVAFGLGTKDGLRTGDLLEVSDEEGRTLGLVEVVEVGEADAWGRTRVDRPLTPGCLVSRDRRG